MLIDADLRGKIWADAFFIQSVLRMNDQTHLLMAHELFLIQVMFSFNASGWRFSGHPYSLQSISVTGLIPSWFSIRESEAKSRLAERIQFTE